MARLETDFDLLGVAWEPRFGVSGCGENVKPFRSGCAILEVRVGCEHLHGQGGDVRGNGRWLLRLDELHDVCTELVGTLLKRRGGGSALEGSSWGAKVTAGCPEALGPAAVRRLPFVVAFLGVTVAVVFVFMVGYHWCMVEGRDEQCRS